MPVSLRAVLLAVLLAAATPSFAADSDMTWDDAAEQSLTQARADYRQLSQAKPQPNDDSLLERTHLLAETVTLLEQQKDLLRRLIEARQRVGEQVARSRDWPGFEILPPYSILMIDRIRQLLDDAQAQAEAANSRAGLMNQEAEDSAKRLSADEVAQRQAEEKSSKTPSGPQKDQFDSQSEIARLRARSAAAAMATSRAGQMLAQAEAAEQTALAELYRKQLTRANQNTQFPQSDLDAVLAELDKQQATQNERLKQSVAAISTTRNALADAQRQLAAAKPEDHQDLAPQLVELRRLQADNADLRHQTIQHLLEIIEWRRSGWQLRWVLANSDNSEKRDQALIVMGQLINRLQSWNRYIQDEYLRSRRLGDDSVPPPGESSREQKALAKEWHDAYAARSQILSDTEQAVGDLLRTLTLWREDFLAQTKQGVLSASLHRGGMILRRALREFWNFELLAAEDSLMVDGRKVIAVRSVTVGKSVGVLFLVVAGAMVSRWLLRGVRAIAVRRFGAPASHIRTVTRWVQLLITSILVVIALYITNIPLTVFAFMGGALAIGIGFGTQILLKNMISGIMLLVERPLRVGDIIEVGDVVGTVTHINIRSSTVRTSDGIEVLVPNASFIENNVTNWTYSNAQVRRTVSVGVDYTSDPEQVAAILRSVANHHEQVATLPPPQVLLADFDSDAIQFTLRYWIDYAGQTDASAIASDLRFMIFRALSDAGIDIPLPQRVVHMKGPAEAS